RIGVIAHLDFGDTAASWQKVIQLGLDRLVEEAGDNLERTESVVEGVKLISFSNPMATVSLNVAFVGTGVVIGSLNNEVVAAIRNHAGGKAVLTATKNYQETIKRLNVQGAEMEVYLQPTLCVDTAMKLLRVAAEQVPDWPEEIDLEGVDRAVTAFGLRSYRSIGGTTQYQGNKSVSRSFTYSPEPERKGVAVTGGKELQLDFLKWVPKDAANLSATTFNAMAVHDALVAAVKAYDPEQAEMLMQALKTYEQQFGLTLKEDLFGILGDHYIWWSMGVSSFLQAPEWAILMKVKDEKRLLKVFETMTNLSEGYVELVPTERRGVKTYRLEINPEMMDEGLAMGLSLFQPCFAFKNGYMVAALSTGDVRRAMKRMDRKDDPKGDIRGNESFASYLSMIPKEQVNAITWTDWRNSFEHLYQALTSALALTMPGDDVPFDLTLLPEAETLSQHLFGAMSWSVVDGTGYSCTMIGPIGPEIVAGVGGLAVVGGGLLYGIRKAGGPVLGRAAAPPPRPVDKLEPIKPVKPRKKDSKDKKEPPKEPPKKKAGKGREIREDKK
ncbi:MAG: hypothetical protein V3U11_01045, partial [Planctomycetota bacterium]